MVLKKHINYQWQLFFPMVAGLWFVLIVVGIWMTHTERNIRVENLRNQVTFVNARIIHAYEMDIDPEDFFKFISDYYIAHPLYDQIQVSTYYNGQLYHYVGTPIKQSDARDFDGITIAKNASEDDETDEQRRRDNFFYDVTRSDDGKLVIYTILPFDDDVIAATQASSSIFYTLISLAVILTGLAYIMSRRLGRNIRSLRDFVLSADADPNFVPTMEFAHDELGDISRQVVKFYNERSRYILELKREHNVAMHAVEEKTRIKRELTNNINHELKTPISVIKGYIDTIKEDPDMDAESRQHFLDKVTEHINRLIQLLNDLSSITRLEYGAQMIHTEPVDFHEVVFQAVNDFESSGVLGNMKFYYDIPTFCRVIGNTALLTGVITNLTKNAVAYSKGTECSLILVDKDKDYLHFSFYDNGIGVKESSLPHLFDRFFREDSGRSRKKGGTGLGLSIVQSSIEALGGKITAANRPGGGLSFTFSLQRVKAQSAATQPQY